MVISKNWNEDDENVKSLVSDKNENAKNVEQIWRSGGDQTSATYMDNISNNCSQIILLCQPNSHIFQTRKIQLEENVEIKVGRSIARSRASEHNAIFDCKVLSRNHAVLWYSDGKFYVKDTKSSNGTFINDRRISHSEAEELNSGDVVKFGVDVIENTRKEIHGCIIACVKLYLSDGREYFSRSSLSSGDSSNGTISFEDFNRLQYYLHETAQREKMLEIKLRDIQNILDLSKKNAVNCWQAMIDEDKLLNKIDALENKLQFYQKNATDDRLKDEVVKLQEEKFSYQNLAKEALHKVYQDRTESIQKLSVIESELNKSQDECSILRDQFTNSEKHIEELNNRLQNMETEYMKYKEQIEIANKENAENSKADSDKNIHFIEKENECEDYKSYIAELLKERNELRKQLNAQQSGRRDSKNESEKEVSENIIMKWFENSDLKKTIDSDEIIKAICSDEPSQSPQSDEYDNELTDENQKNLHHKVDSVESIATTKAEDEEDDDERSLITSVGYDRDDNQVQIENALNLRKDIDAFRETSKELLLCFSTNIDSTTQNNIIDKDDDNLVHIKELLLKISLMESKIEKYTDELEKQQRTKKSIEIILNKKNNSSNEETKIISEKIKVTESRIEELENENDLLREEIVNLKNNDKYRAPVIDHCSDEQKLINSSTTIDNSEMNLKDEKQIKEIENEIKEEIQTLSNINIRHEEELIIWKEKYENLISDNRNLKQKMEEIKSNTNSLINNSYFIHFFTVGAALIAVICYLILSKF